MLHLFQSVSTIIKTAVLGAALAVSAWLSPQVPLGAAIPGVVANFETSLVSAISSSDTSMTLVRGTDAAGNSLSGYICFTIDEGSASAEFVCGTASSTSVTSMLRGIDPQDGDTEVAALKKSHRRGASVKITNYPSQTVLTRILNGQETIPNVLTYDSSITTSSFTNAQQLVNKAYADALSFAGTPDASEAQKGVVEIATPAELISGTATGSTGAILSAPVSRFNATSSATTTIPVTNASGKLSQGFLDLTQPFSWSGAHTFSSTTTFSGSVSGILRFGAGDDGDVTIGAGTTTTLSRDMFYDDLVVSGTLVTNGYKIHVRNTLTGAGTIEWNGNAGSNATGSTPGTGGSALTSASVPGSLAGITGAPGDTSSGDASGGQTLTLAIGASTGVSGGTGASCSAAGGSSSAGSVTLNRSSSTLRTGVHLFSFTAFNASSTLQLAQGQLPGSGGGAGSNNGGTSGAGGGGGGSAGGTVWLAISNLSGFTGTIRSLGGNGGSGGSGTNMPPGGGGSGGNGGTIVIIYDTDGTAYTTSVAGGTGGQPGTTACGSATAGSNGNTGLIFKVKYSEVIR